ncbi:MAG: hypothetical protein IJS45_05035 [Clostridia bacterium]|nr:hypothetical protein [Clostridia bacterium]
MMRLKKLGVLMLAVLFAAALFSGCDLFKEEKVIGPEVGAWHAEIKLNDVSGSMSDEDKALMSMLAGNIMFEIDAEFCEDGTFTYVMNTDKLKESLSSSLSTVLGFFMNYDISLFTDRLIEAALQDALQSSKYNYAGTYESFEDNLIMASDGDMLYFKVNGKTLIQLDDSGNEVVRFTKVS